MIFFYYYYAFIDVLIHRLLTEFGLNNLFNKKIEIEKYFNVNLNFHKHFFSKIYSHKIARANVQSVKIGYLRSKSIVQDRKICFCFT